MCGRAVLRRKDTAFAIQVTSHFRRLSAETPPPKTDAGVSAGGSLANAGEEERELEGNHISIRPAGETRSGRKAPHRRVEVVLAVPAEQQPQLRQWPQVELDLVVAAPFPEQFDGFHVPEPKTPSFQRESEFEPESESESKSKTVSVIFFFIAEASVEEEQLKGSDQSRILHQRDPNQPRFECPTSLHLQRNHQSLRIRVPLLHHPKREKDEEETFPPNAP